MGTFRLNGSRFELIGSDGNTRWTTDEKLFRVTNALTGSVTFPIRTVSSAGVVSSDTDTYLGPCEGGSTFVNGYFKATSHGGTNLNAQPFTDVGDWIYANGTYVGFPIESAATGARLDDVIALTFFASGGGVYLNERLLLYYYSTGEFAQGYSLPAYTIQYELWVGTFS